MSPSTAPSRPPPSELLTVLEETIKVRPSPSPRRACLDRRLTRPPLQTHGPLAVPRFMTLCLNHPTLGYYTTRTVFGKEGDFVTSPEISQVFGEVRLVLPSSSVSQVVEERRPSDWNERTT